MEIQEYKIILEHFWKIIVGLFSALIAGIVWVYREAISRISILEEKEQQTNKVLDKVKEISEDMEKIEAQISSYSGEFRKEIRDGDRRVDGVELLISEMRSKQNQHYTIMEQRMDMIISDNHDIKDKLSKYDDNIRSFWKDYGKKLNQDE